MSLTRSGQSRRIHRSRGFSGALQLRDPGLALRHRSGVVQRIRVHGKGAQVPSDLAIIAREAAARLPLGRIAMVAALLVVVSMGLLLGAKAYASSKELSIRIENGIFTSDTVTTAGTVDELLAQNNIKLGPNDAVTPAGQTRLSDGMVVTIDRAMIVFVTSAGQMQQVYMTGGTVDDALMKAGIDYDQDDEITPSATTRLSAGLRIRHVSVENVLVSEKYTIPHETIYKNSSTVLKGKVQLGQSGSDGIRTRQIQITYKDGEEVGRAELSNTVTKEPQDRIVLQGTKVEVKQTTTKPEKSSESSSSPSSGGKKPSGTKEPTGTKAPSGTKPPSSTKPPTSNPAYANVTADDLKIPSIPNSFVSTLNMTITAYTHTGRHTAMGGWPQYTRTLQKPGTIAVDPDFIPYGTLLYVTGYGYCVTEDTGVDTSGGIRIGDVFMNTEAQCITWGRRRNVKVYIVDESYKR